MSERAGRHPDPMPRLLTHRLFVLSVLLAAGVIVPGTAAGSSDIGHASKVVVPKDGRYKGFAGVDTIRFTVTSDGKKITGLVTTYNPAADCSIPTSAQTESFGTLEIHDGTFKGSTSTSGGADETFSIDGHFASDTRAEGTIHGHLVVKSLPPCNDHAPFTVTRA
jgi:hypothetical protein